MIEGFSLKTAHHFGDALASQARLRYDVFVRQRGLDHLHYDELEYDEFDTPAAFYLVWRDQHQIVRGLIRLLPTERPYMIQTVWPYVVEHCALPKTHDIWEITRVCVDRNYEAKSRLRIMPELLCAVQEFFQSHGIKAMIGLTRPHLVNHYLRDGVTWLGDEREIEGEQEAAFLAPVEFIRPKYHCAKFGINRPVLITADDQRKVA